tara:strand:- start:277 stop:717 length:441 start_codon:yes stop_codon:yes gene_type:complete
MTNSNRFEDAINKLYSAFHQNTLNPEDCKQCAVGNILDNKDSWENLTDLHGSIRLNYLGLVHQNLGRKFNGYTPLELLKIEASFLNGCGYRLGQNYCHKPDNRKDKDILFNGLCEVVSTLCALDRIEDIMNCFVLFEYENQITDIN